MTMTGVREIAGRLGAFKGDRAGSILPFVAFALVPLIGLGGGFADYARALTVRTQLNAAADAAALAAVGQSAMTKSVADAKLEGERFFDTDSAEYKSMLSSRTVTITSSGLSRSVEVTYTAAVPVYFMHLFGITKIDVSGRAASSGMRAPYIDFYLMLDNSPSMGVAATQADIDKMVANTGDKCAFACHDLSNANNYYNKAKKLGVQMRIDVVRQASQQLMDTAKSTATLQNQYRMAAYTLGPSCDGKKLTAIQSITSDLIAAKTATGKVDLMTIPYDQFDKDQCTDFNKAMTAMNGAISSPGDGASSASPQKVLYFVSDGVGDYYNPSSCSRKLTGTRCQEPIDTSFCKTIKDRGIKIAVLYTTYLPLPTNSWYNSWIKPFSADIPKKMEACASPGLFFEVSINQGIAEAMTALFQRVVSKAYLSS